MLLSAKATFRATNCNDKLIKAKDRGGLWTVNPAAVSIFEEAELYFRKNVVDKSATCIDGKKIVNDLMKECMILAYFSNLRRNCPTEMEKELSLNLLEDLLTLFIRTRTFSYVNQKKDKYRLESKRQKMKALRTAIKKSSETLEMGH